MPKATGRLLQIFAEKSGEPASVENCYCSGEASDCATGAEGKLRRSWDDLDRCAGVDRGGPSPEKTELAAELKKQTNARKIKSKH